jgi:type II secretory pathway component PulF
MRMEPPAKKSLAFPLAVAVAWLVWVVIAAQRQAPVLGSLLDGLGTPLPAPTRILLALALHAWLHEAFFRPLLGIVEAIG